MFNASQWNCFNLVDTYNIALILFLKCDVTKCHCYTSSTPSPSLNVWRNLWMAPKVKWQKMLKEGKSTTPTWLTSIDITEVERAKWKDKGAFSQHCGFHLLLQLFICKSHAYFYYCFKHCISFQRPLCNL